MLPGHEGDKEMPARRPPFPFSATLGIVLGTGGPGWRLPDGRVFSPAEELAVAMGGEFYPMDEISAARILAVVGRDRAGHGKGRRRHMVPGQERKLMEERFGEIGKGLTELTIEGERYDLYQQLRLLGMDHADIRPIDAHYVNGSDRYAIRYFDFEERVIVAYEFDTEFAYCGEHRVHIDEWMGDDYYNFPWGVFCADSP